MPVVFFGYLDVLMICALEINAGFMRVLLIQKLDVSSCTLQDYN